MSPFTCTYGFDTIRRFKKGRSRGKKDNVDWICYCKELLEKLATIEDSVDVGKTVQKKAFAPSIETKKMDLKFLHVNLEKSTIRFGLHVKARGD